MGSCCYQPSKGDFLWWYWLLLVSIVGIPMLLAVLYVARQPAADDELAKQDRGRTAAWIFWVGTFVVGIASFFVVFHVLTDVYDDQGHFRKHDYAAGWWVLAVQFFFATVMANLTNDWTRKQKRWYKRITLTTAGVFLFLLAFMVLAIVLHGAMFLFRRPALNVMQFMVCMLPAHHWGKFKDSPDTPHAWRALAAFVVAAPLVFLVAYFGEDVVQLLLPVAPGGK
jgi:uncharacterized membrane protein